MQLLNGPGRASQSHMDIVPLLPIGEKAVKRFCITNLLVLVVAFAQGGLSRHYKTN